MLTKEESYKNGDEGKRGNLEPAVTRVKLEALAQTHLLKRGSVLQPMISAVAMQRGPSFITSCSFPHALNARIDQMLGPRDLKLKQMYTCTPSEVLEYRTSMADFVPHLSSMGMRCNTTEEGVRRPELDRLRVAQNNKS